MVLFIDLKIVRKSGKKRLKRGWMSLLTSAVRLAKDSPYDRSEHMLDVSLSSLGPSTYTSPYSFLLVLLGRNCRRQEKGQSHTLSFSNKITPDDGFRKLTRDFSTHARRGVEESILESALSFSACLENFLGHHRLSVTVRCSVSIAAWQVPRPEQYIQEYRSTAWSVKRKGNLSAFMHRWFDTTKLTRSN